MPRQRAFSVLIAMVLGATASSAVELREERKPEGVRLIMESDWLRLAIAPRRGGRVVSCIWKADGRDWIPSGDSGLFIDHLTQQPWPGELMDREYEYEITNSGPAVASVRLWTRVRGEGDDSISGLLLEKSLSLQQGARHVRVAYRLHNPTDAFKSPKLWIQHIVAAAGAEQQRHCFRPTTIGPLHTAWGSEVRSDGDPETLQFRFDPVAGWTAQVHPPSRQGVVFLMDYNWLKCLYCCLSGMTTEWWYEAAVLPPDASFETAVSMVPFEGLASVAHASEHVIAELEVVRDGRTVSVAHRVLPGPRRPQRGDVKLELVEFRSRKVVEHKTTGFQLGDAPAEQVLMARDVPEELDLVARATVYGSGYRETYERFSGGAAIIGTESVYTRPRPEQVRPIHRPDTLVKTRNAAPRILHLRGLFQLYYRWPEVTRTLSGELRESNIASTIFGTSLSYFPLSYDDLLAFDLIVLDNVPGNVLDAVKLQYLEDFVKAGGAVLVIGGPMAFHAGGYAGTALERLLPVTCAGPFDIGRHPVSVPLASEQPGAGCFQYFQKVDPKPGSTRLFGSAERSVLILHRLGKGVVAVFVPLCFGDLAEGTGFWEAPDYPAWMAAVVRAVLQQTETYANAAETD